jgi:signal transduction histidine kinase
MSRPDAMPIRRLAIVFAAIVASFVAATAAVHWQMRAIDRAAVGISENAAPSIEYLTAARVELRHLQSLLRDEHLRDPSAIDESRRALNRAVDAYLELPLLPDEGAIWRHVFRARATLDADPTLSEEHVSDLNDALTTAVRADAGHAGDFAREIQTFRAGSTRLALALDIACTLIAMGGAIVVLRLMREHAALVERQRELHRERATELESFAGRVAHDILSPLGTVAFALSLATQQSDRSARHRLLSRGTAAVDRIKKLVDGLLDFARAGGRPPEGAQADLDATIADLVAELEPTAAAAGAELSVERDGAHVVACNPGVLTSLVANLARNAIKYLGDRPVRHVEIRAQDLGRSVRVEVADTGPGLPPEIEKRVFEPYVRAPNASQPGVGLGLATVKRLAEAHGGKVGVESVPGSGSTFWFELPKAASPRAASGRCAMGTAHHRNHSQSSAGP